MRAAKRTLEAKSRLHSWLKRRSYWRALHPAYVYRSREVELGCPLNNLAQEMSRLDEQFRRRVTETFDTLTDAFARALERGQSAGTVRRDLDARKVAAFTVASIEGSFGLAKGARSAALLRSNLEVLGAFLESLRPAPSRGRRARIRHTSR